MRDRNAGDEMSAGTPAGGCQQGWQPRRPLGGDHTVPPDPRAALEHPRPAPPSKGTPESPKALLQCSTAATPAVGAAVAAGEGADVCLRPIAPFSQVGVGMQVHLGLLPLGH